MAIGGWRKPFMGWQGDTLRWIIGADYSKIVTTDF